MKLPHPSIVDYAMESVAEAGTPNMTDLQIKLDEFQEKLQVAQEELATLLSQQKSEEVILMTFPNMPREMTKHIVNIEIVTMAQMKAFLNSLTDAEVDALEWDMDYEGTIDLSRESFLEETDAEYEKRVAKEQKRFVQTYRKTSEKGLTDQIKAKRREIGGFERTIFNLKGETNKDAAYKTLQGALSEELRPLLDALLRKKN